MKVFRLLFAQGWIFKLNVLKQKRKRIRQKYSTASRVNISEVKAQESLILRANRGTAISTAVSVVFAGIVRQNIEEQALATYEGTLPLWLRYVDDICTAVHKDDNTIQYNTNFIDTP